jgi:hypothetical protein
MPSRIQRQLDDTAFYLSGRRGSRAGDNQKSLKPIGKRWQKDRRHVPTLVGLANPFH